MAKRTQQRIARGFEKLQDRVDTLRSRFEEADSLVRNNYRTNEDEDEEGLDLEQLQNDLQVAFNEEASEFEARLFGRVQDIFTDLENSLQGDDTDYTNGDLDEVVNEISEELNDLSDAISTVSDDVAVALEA